MSTPPGRLANKPATHDAFASSAIRKAKRYVEEHYTEKISARALAEDLNISAEHFCRTFKQATGVRFTEFVTRIRVAKARERLANSNQPVSQIAFDCGFQSLAQFNRMFKRFAGQTPTEFRRSPNF